MKRRNTNKTECKKVSKVEKGIWLAKDSQGHFFFVNKKGRRLTDEYETISRFKEGWACFANYHGCGFINTQLKTLGGHFDMAGSFSEGLALVGMWSKKTEDEIAYCYMNKKGEIVLGPYYDALDFKKGEAKVKMSPTDKRRVRINKRGEMIRPKKRKY